MTIESIKSIIDSCIGKNNSNIELELNNLLDKIVPHILLSYDNSRNVVQYTLGQLDRVHTHIVCVMMARILNHVQGLCNKFERGTSRDDDYLNVKWREDEIKEILKKAMSYYQGDFRINVVNMEFANSLSSDERRKLVSYIIGSVQYYGTNTHWTKDIIERDLYT